jgi:hypothetical protein
MKYTLVYFDEFYKYQWAGNCDSNDETSISTSAIGNIKKTYPTSKIINIASDGWIEVEITKEIKVRSAKNLQQEIDKILKASGRIIDCYNVFNEKNQLIKLEGGIYEQEKF